MTITATLPRRPRRHLRAAPPLPTTRAAARAQVRPAPTHGLMAPGTPPAQVATGAAAVQPRPASGRPIDSPLGPPTFWESILLLLGAGIVQPLYNGVETMIGS